MSDFFEHGRRWRKSSRSDANETCVELAHTLDAVRDSKNPAGPVLRGDVRRLLRAVRVG
ncbi:DUF397 domain-containing protein [Actinokineospora sp.]|uniref:DUF397 domain-containing protein n=1 Tax=Actinokineospora sp. TaxID=1872133 RepID=UPI003D6A351A